MLRDPVDLGHVEGGRGQILRFASGHHQHQAGPAERGHRVARVVGAGQRPRARVCGWQWLWRRTIVLAPIFWGRVRKRDIALGTALLAALYLPFTLGTTLPVGAVPNVVEHIRFNSKVGGARWDEDAKVWHVSVENGDTYTARSVVAGVGDPQTAGQEAEDFRRWTSAYQAGKNEATDLDHGFELEGGGEFLAHSVGDWENFLAARPAWQNFFGFGGTLSGNATAVAGIRAALEHAISTTLKQETRLVVTIEPSLIEMHQSRQDDMSTGSSAAGEADQEVSDGSDDRLDDREAPEQQQVADVVGPDGHGGACFHLLCFLKVEIRRRHARRPPRPAPARPARARRAPARRSGRPRRCCPRRCARPRR